MAGATPARATAAEVLRRFLIASVALLSLASGAEAATAGTAANTILRNTITISYSDIRNVPQPAVTAGVDVSVTTVSATPSLIMPASGTTDGSGSTWSYTLRVRTNSNGPRLVTLGASDTASVNMSGYGAPPSGLPASVFLGSTAIDPSDTHGTIANWASGAAITFNVPNDGGVPSDSAESGGSSGDGVVNGLKAGDMVYLYSGSDYYGPFTAGRVTEVPAGSGTSVAPCTIELFNNLGAGTLTNLPTSYAQIVEAKDVTMTVTQGAVTDPTRYSSWTTTVSATMAAAAAASSPLVTDSHMGKISVTKYVRNLTTPTTFGTGSYTFSASGSSNLYYTGGVSGRSGEILEYLEVISDVGSGAAQSVVITDVLPGYTTLISGSGYGVSGGGDIFAHAWFNNKETDLAIGNSGLPDVAYGTASASPQIITFRVGTGCTPAAGGTLDTSLPSPQPASTAYLVYQVKIN